MMIYLEFLFYFIIIKKVRQKYNLHLLSFKFEVSHFGHFGLVSLAQNNFSNLYLVTLLKNHFTFLNWSF